MHGSKYHIVYPCGDRSALSVVEICNGMEHELTDYDVASRESFSRESDAEEYATELARKNKKEFRGNQPEYLD